MNTLLVLKDNAFILYLLLPKADISKLFFLSLSYSPLLFLILMLFILLSITSHLSMLYSIPSPTKYMNYQHHHIPVSAAHVSLRVTTRLKIIELAFSTSVARSMQKYPSLSNWYVSPGLADIRLGSTYAFESKDRDCWFKSFKKSPSS